MDDRLEKVAHALERIAAVLGAECDPHSPAAEEQANAKGAINATTNTDYDGTKPAPQLVSLAPYDTGVQVEGHMLVCSRILDLDGAELPGALIGVYLTPPTAATNAPIPMAMGGWMKRRRGFERFWVVNLRPALGEAFPVLTMVSDPGVEVGGTCCEVPEEPELNLLTLRDEDDTAWSASDTPLTIASVTVPVGGGGEWQFSFDAYMFTAANKTYDLAYFLTVNGVATKALGTVANYTAVASQSNAAAFGMTWQGNLVAGDVVEVVVLDNLVVPTSKGFNRVLAGMRTRVTP